MSSASTCVYVSAVTLSELPWESRQELLQRIAEDDSMRSIREAFDAVGTSRPVTLTSEQKGQVVRLDEWSTKVPRGWEDLPEGLYDLRCALLHDLAA